LPPLYSSSTDSIGITHAVPAAPLFEAAAHSEISEWNVRYALVMLLAGEGGMHYELVQDRSVLDTWRVEAVNDEGDGEVYVATFSGPNARERAEEYAHWKNGSRDEVLTAR
jgi:hypothetical protein